MTDSQILWGATALLGLSSAWVYYQFFQKVPLFELEEQKSVLRTAAWLPDDEQTTLFATGIRGITRHEWKSIKRRVSKEVSKHLGAQDLTMSSWHSLNGQLEK